MTTLQEKLVAALIDADYFASMMDEKLAAGDLADAAYATDRLTEILTHAGLIVCDAQTEITIARREG